MHVCIGQNDRICSSSWKIQSEGSSILHIFGRGSGQKFHDGISSWVWQISKNFDQIKVIRNWNTLTFLKLQEFDIAYFYTVTMPKNQLFNVYLTKLSIFVYWHD